MRPSSVTNAGLTTAASNDGILLGQLEPICSNHGLNVRLHGVLELGQATLYFQVGSKQRAAPLRAGVRIHANGLKGEEHIADRALEVCLFLRVS